MPTDREPASLAWMEAAACADYPDRPEWWFPSQSAVVDAQRGARVCERCPARRACLNYAITEQITEGIWGGLSPSGRRKLGRPIAA